jgi:hypothetical protein
LTTGIVELDSLLAVLGAGDSSALQERIRYQQVACATQSEVGGPPICRGAEADGDVVEVFEYSVCEPVPLREDEVGQALTVLSGASIYAVYATPAQADLDPPAEQVVVITDASNEAQGLAWELFVEGGDIVALRFSCALFPQELIDQRTYGEAIVPPAPS